MSYRSRQGTPRTSRPFNPDSSVLEGSSRCQGMRAGKARSLCPARWIPAVEQSAVGISKTMAPPCAVVKSAGGLPYDSTRGKAPGHEHPGPSLHIARRARRPSMICLPELMLCCASPDKPKAIAAAR